MRLAVDASSLVAEIFRARGRDLVQDPDLDLFIASNVLSESERELDKRLTLIRNRGFLEARAAQRLLDDALAVIANRVTAISAEVYAQAMDEAYRRIPRDPTDAPTVALALTLGCGIWTADRDFFGCGLPIWTTDTLVAHREAQRSR